METAPATAAPSAALVHQPAEYRGLQMQIAPAEAERRLRELQAFVAAAMTPEIDFMAIVEGQKPSLLQPGAQKLCELYGLAPTFSFDTRLEDWDKGFFYYLVRAELRDIRSGALVGSGLGSCNSKEKKYAGRWVPISEVAPYLKASCPKREALNFLWPDKLPPGVEIKGLPTRSFRSKAGKTHTLYGITQEEGFVPNEDVFSIVNTLLKMALKRALVHAVLGVTRSSGIFSQDVEDLPEEAYGVVEERRPWQRQEPIDAEVVEHTPAASAAASVDPLVAKRAKFMKAIGDTKDGPSFTAEWKKLSEDPDYNKLREGFRQLYTEKRAAFWPAAAAPAASSSATAAPAAAAQATPAAPTPAATTEATGAPATAPQDEVKRARALSMISTAGGDEDEAVFERLNDLYDGNVPKDVMDRYDARWPSQAGQEPTA